MKPVDVAKRVFESIVARKREATAGPHVSESLFQYAAGMVSGAREVLGALERENTTMFDFGVALSVLRSGGRVQRSGWNGKGMWLALTAGRTIEAGSFWSAANREWATSQPQGVARVLPYITMKTADDGIVPWLASQTDVLAHDWQDFAPAPVVLPAPILTADGEHELVSAPPEAPPAADPSLDAFGRPHNT